MNTTLPSFSLFKMESTESDTELDQVPIIDEDVLLWRSSIATNIQDKSEEVVVDPDSYDYIRRKSKTTPPEMHPLLQKIAEMEGCAKHGDYTAHVLIQKQARDYALTVEDALLLLKTATEQVIDKVQYWRGYDALDDDDIDKCLLEWKEATPGTNVERLQLTSVGRKIIKMSESIKSLHDEDTLAFWTSEQREEIFRHVVHLSEDIVKLRRKLERIKGSLEDRVRNVRRTAIKCECDITGNLVPSEIYYEWVAEDVRFNKFSTNVNELDVTRAKISGKKVTSPSSKSKKYDPYTGRIRLSTMQKAMNLAAAACTQPHSDDDEPNETPTSSLASSVVVVGTTGSLSSSISNTAPTSFSLPPSPLSMPVKLYLPKRYPEVEVLHKDTPGKSGEDATSVYEGSLNDLHAKEQGEEKQWASSSTKSVLANPQDSTWMAKPSQKFLQTIASNMAPPPKFTTNEFASDHSESKIKQTWDKRESSILQDNVARFILQNTTGSSNAIVQNWIQKFPNNPNDKIVSASSIIATGCSSTNANMITTTEKTSDPEDPKKCNNNPQSEQGPPPEESASTSPPMNPLPPGKLLSESMTQEISLIKLLITSVHNAVARTTWSIREMERMWISPPDTMDIKSRTKKTPAKQLLKMIDFIVDTAKLTDNPEFASRLYPEDKHEIIAVLDPVFRELTNCFMAIYMLRNLVDVDISYLKQLVIGFPRGSLVIRDWVSDPSLDEELADMELSTANSDFDVDVNELFAY